MTRYDISKKKNIFPVEKKHDRSRNIDYRWSPIKLPAPGKGKGMQTRLLTSTEVTKRMGIEGYVGIGKGSWLVLGGVGYEDAFALDDPKKEDITGRLVLVKTF